MDERAKDFGPVKRAPSAAKASKRGKASGVLMNVQMVPQGSVPEVQPSDAEFADMDDYLSKCSGLCDVVGMIKVRSHMHPRGRITIGCSLRHVPILCTTSLFCVSIKCATERRLCIDTSTFMLCCLLRYASSSRSDLVGDHRRSNHHRLGRHVQVDTTKTQC